MPASARKRNFMIRNEIARDLEAETTPEPCRAAFRLMKACRVTFYGAAYHAVALLRDWDVGRRTKND